ncbi:hypothetical protein BKA65DRAFT_602183 [Rhexocercosporidium sp. MPI-PUGE-AT-0058]|nr:hypothetical protein BKA65DRAFT_602183 [Rhexocercosporidium sp. MPI-PUGE-AT-0058]
MAAKQNSGSHGTGLFFNLYGKTHNAGSLLAWAWGGARATAKEPSSSTHYNHASRSPFHKNPAPDLIKVIPSHGTYSRALIGFTNWEEVIINYTSFYVAADGA